MAPRGYDRQPPPLRAPDQARQGDGARARERRRPPEDLGVDPTTSGVATMKKRYAIAIERGERNYSAYVPDVDGCISTGRTLEETRANIAAALAFHFEGMAADGDPIPEPTTT